MSDGWHVVASRGDLADEGAYNEDKFAVLLSPAGLPLIGAAIQLSSLPLRGKPPPSSGRGMHYTLDGSILDVWQWRASHGGPSGHIDNCARRWAASPMRPTRAKATLRAGG